MTESDHSSDSDSFEIFLSSLRKPKTQSKYRSSTGSLSKFIADDSHCDSKSESDKENTPYKTTATLKQHKVADNMVGKDDSINQPTALKDAKNFTNITYKRLPNVKSVATPLKKLLFSSDSDDDEVFQLSSRQLIKRSISHKATLVFTDSDEKHDFDIPSNIPSYVFSSDSESDSLNTAASVPGVKKSSISGKQHFVPATHESTFSKDSDSEDIFLSLKSRLLQQPCSSQVSSCKTPPSLRLSDAKFLTKKYCYSEKPICRTKQTCSVKNCFLSSLDLSLTKKSQLHYKHHRGDLTNRLYKLFNESVFDNRLPAGLEINWAKRMTKTAGTTTCRRVCKSISDRTSISYEASISLSEKVIDSASRLRDTLIHEMCHVAVWVLDKATESHGPYWKSWAAKARRVHPELPLVERCHNYDIKYKYIYKCKRCDTTYGRHSKSIDTEKKVCGRCAGKLVLNSNGSSKVKGANPFANFVKLNYNNTKTDIVSTSGQVSHRDVMRSLSEQFKAISVS